MFSRDTLHNLFGRLRSAGCWLETHVTKLLHDTRVSAQIMTSSETNSLNSLNLIPIITTVSVNTCIASRNSTFCGLVRFVLRIFSKILKSFDDAMLAGFRKLY